MKGLILTTALLNFFFVHSSQAAEIAWEKDFEVAQKKAQDTGKLLLIDFYHPK
jgi:hypothetical protein